MYARQTVDLEAEPTFLSHPFPDRRWAEPKPTWVGKRALD